MTKDYKKKHQLKIESRIRHLFDEAYEVRISDPSSASRYIFLARKLAAKAKVRIPRELKRQFCKACNIFFVHGKNCTVRTTGKTISYTCKVCKKITRIGYK